MNSTKVDWGDETVDYQKITTNITTGTGMFYPVDFNGDGRTDFIKLYYQIDDNENVIQDEYGNLTYEKWELYLADQNGTDFTLDDTGQILAYAFYLPGDFNGDGKGDLLQVTIQEGQFHFDVLSYGDDGANIISTGLTKPVSSQRDIHVGDFNGDSKTDLFIGKQTIYMDTGFNLQITYQFDIYQFQNTLFYHSSETIIDDLICSKFDVADYSGNGKANILILSGNNMASIYEFQNYTMECISENDMVNASSLYSGDFNGDSKSDLLTWHDNQWYLYLFDGQNFIEKDAPGLVYWKDPDESLSDNNYFIADYNGDGKSDILESFSIWENGVSSSSEMNIFYSKGHDFTKYHTILNHPAPHNWGFKNGTDFNGDGKADCLVLRFHLDLAKIYYFNPYDESNLIKSITNGLNNTVHFEYAPLTDETVYTKLDVEEYPYNDFQGGIYVVQKLISEDGIGGRNTQTYKYEGAKVHKLGKGFLGFLSIEAFGNLYAIRNESNFPSARYPVLLKGASIKTAISDGEEINKEITYYHSKNLFNNKTIFFHPDKKYNFKSLSNIYTETDFIFDDFGNLTQEYIAFGNDTKRTITNITYGTHGSWCPNKAESKTVSMQRPDKPTHTRQSQFEYYPNGQLQKTIIDPNLSNTITTEYFYNDYGLPTGSQTTAPGQEMRSTSQTYDDKFRFVTSQTDVLGFTSYASYDTETGNTLSETDINGHTTSYKYDAFGRLTETLFPDGTSAYQSTDWYKGSDIANAHTVSISGADGQSPVTTYFDRLGRKIRTESLSFDNQSVISEIEYNNKGQVRKSTEAHFEGETGNSSLYYYDNYGRPTATESDAGSLQYDYAIDNNPRKNKITYPDGSFKITEINAFGEAQSIEDNGGIINYTYNAAGQPVSIIPPGPAGSEITITYDAYGNRTSITDPDAGTISYEYDAFSNITKQTDARGNEYTMSYDIAGRIISQTGPEGTESYAYDTAPNGKGMIASEEGLNSHSKTYSYDALSRLQSVSESFEGQNYVYSYTYDALGRTETTTYPSGFAYTKHYKTNGYLDKITRADNGQLIWQVNTMNALDQVTQYTKGNGISTTKTYDNLHYPETVTSPGVESSEYSFEAASGNLQYRTHGANTEIFSYDELNRLTDITFNSQTSSIDYTADNSGNIDYKYDAGDYTYDSEKVHAVSDVVGENTIPFYDQDISYTAFNKMEQISEGPYTLDFTYGLDRARKKTVLKENGLPVLQKYFFGSYEIREDLISGDSYEYHFLPGGAIYRTANGAGEMLYTYTDYLGSITHITDENGNVLHRQSFGAWGRERDPDSYENFPSSAGQGNVYTNDRGYTGHEMLPHFGLINMNGRLYDPILGRMLSPDPFVQMPDYSQNFNRYAYVYNNPLKYTDPTGYWAGWDDVIVGGVGFIFGYVSYGIQNDDWGWNAVGQGAITAGTFLLGYYTSGSGTMASEFSYFGLQGAANRTAATYAFEAVASTMISNSMPAVTFPIDESSSITISTGMGFGTNGLVFGVNIAGSYTDGSTTYTFGQGIGTNHVSWGASVSQENWSAGMYWTHYGDAIGPDGISNEQTVGGVHFAHGQFTARLENDFLGDGHDRWRSNAVELGFWGGDVIVGTTLYNNYRKEGDPVDMSTQYYHKHSLKNKDYGRWIDGQTYSSPLYVGLRSGNSITRVGYSHPVFQHAAQNWFAHQAGFARSHLFGYANYFMDYKSFRYGMHLYSGYYNPYSLWGR